MSTIPIFLRDNALVIPSTLINVSFFPFNFVSRRVCKHIILEGGSELSSAIVLRFAF